MRPSPKPTAIKIIEGNTDKQKIKNAGESIPPALDAVSKTPARLHAEAKKKWKRARLMVRELPGSADVATRDPIENTLNGAGRRCLTNSRSSV